jgi:uncharacterized protein (DUF1330 family)
MADRPAYLLLLAAGIERRRFADYVAEMSPQVTQHGGLHMALAPSPSVEPFGHHDAPTSVMVARWDRLADLRAFWQSPPCRQLREQRSRLGTFVAAALEAPECAAETSSDAVLAIFLGAGPSPALLEAEGARALALVRENRIETLEGTWTHGDVAMYGWTSAQCARRQMVLFSSGQRGRALLVPALKSTQPPLPIRQDTRLDGAVAA